MSNIAENNRRIAKNTLYLYGRMLFSLVVSLFTARIVFNALGVHDYGVLNVVGGFVGLLTYLNMLLQQGTSRFVTINKMLRKWNTETRSRIDYLLDIVEGKIASIPLLVN